MYIGLIVTQRAKYTNAIYLHRRVSPSIVGETRYWNILSCSLEDFDRDFSIASATIIWTYMMRAQIRYTSVFFLMSCLLSCEVSVTATTCIAVN